MMKAVLINLSPRKNGTSVMLANMCKDKFEKKGYETVSFNLYNYLGDMSDIRKGIKEADTIVFCGPCYVNHFPADTIALLENIISNPDILHGQSVYAIIQGGMPYVHTHESGIKTLELFCKDCDLQYKGGFVIGLGAYLNGKPIDSLPNAKKIKKNFNLLIDHMLKGEVSPDSLYKSAQIKLPGIAYKVLAKRMNSIIRKDLLQHNIDYKQENPYLRDISNF